MANKKSTPYIQKINDTALEALSSGDNDAEDWVGIIITAMATDYDVELEDQAEESIYVFKELMEGICTVEDKDIRKVGALIIELRQKYRDY